VDEFAMTGAWAGDFARRVQLWHRNKMTELEEWVAEDPNSTARVAWATLESIGSNFAAAMVDPLKLGEGAATGTVEGWLTDALRAIDLFSSMRGAVRIAGRLPETGFKSIKRIGQQLAPQNVLNAQEKMAYSNVLRDRYVLGVRAVDPATGWGSRRAAEQGIFPKPLTAKGKSQWGVTEVVEEYGDLKIVTKKRSDADLAWVWDKNRGRYLNEAEVTAEIIKPINAQLPPTMHIQHGAHFNAWQGSKGMGTLTWSEYGKLPGNPGPVALMNGSGEIGVMSAKQVKAYAQRNGLPWHPAWDKVEAIWTDVNRDALKLLTDAGQRKMLKYQNVNE
jgi:hypothetical protein